MQSLHLNEDRFFDPDPTIRSVARELYSETKSLAIVGPHGHVEPSLLAENESFPEPASLFITPDHYVFRMLYSQGIDLEDLGIPSLDGTVVETDSRKIWKLFADHYYLFAGTPTGAWFDHALHEVFGIRHRLDSDSAMFIYDEISEKLGSPEFRPRALFDQFNIEVLTTTDAATDSLEHHKAIIDSDWNGRVLPCFRPDKLFRISNPSWKEQLSLLEKVTGKAIESFSDFILAIESRRSFFRSMGATSTDHAVMEPWTKSFQPGEEDVLFTKANMGTADLRDQAHFEAGMLMEMARMSTGDGMVMQIHPGSFLNHNVNLTRRFGADKGCDIPISTEYTGNLRELLNTFGNDKNFRFIVFTLDETTYTRELAPLAGHYPAMFLGPAWWFHDSIAGMTRYREQVTESAGVYNTVGFNDDTRAFCSIPARHDLSRRVDANYLANLVARHIIDLSDARKLARAMAYDLVKSAYRL